MIPTGFAAFAMIGAFFVGYFIGKWSGRKEKEVD